MATPRLGLVVEDKPTELSCSTIIYMWYCSTYSNQLCLSSTDQLSNK